MTTEAPRVHLILAAAGLAVFAALAMLVGFGADWLTRADLNLERRAHRAVVSHDWLLSAARDVTQLGNPVVVDVVLVVVVIVTIARAGWWAGLLVALARAAEIVAETASKNGIGRPRPSLPDPVYHAGGFSFPSGHAAGSALWTVLAAASLVGMLGSRGSRVVAWSTAAVIATAVAASRVLLGVHYLSDVVGGTTLGAGVAFAGLAAIRPRRPTPPRR